jgi:hypothetical protein
MITSEQIDDLNKLGYNFHWSISQRESLDYCGENEMGISYDPLHVGHPAPYTLRTRKWNDESCQYEDEYDRFETFKELKAYLT